MRIITRFDIPLRYALASDALQTGRIATAKYCSSGDDDADGADDDAV